MSRTELRLNKAFADVLATLLATAAVTACGGSTESTTTTTGGGGGGGGVQPTYATACAKTNKSFLQGLNVTPPIDGAVMRSEQAFPLSGSPDFSGGVVGGGEPEDGDAWQGSDGERVGALCSTATNAAACLSKVQGFRVLPPTREACKAQHPATSYANVDCSVNYILYTRGDEIGVARNVAEMKALAGTFDTLEEALWVTANKGLERSCGSTQIKDSQYRTTADGGWDFVLIDRQNCGPTTFEVTVHVDAAGNLTEVSRKDLKVPANCAVAGRRPEGLAAYEVASAGSDCVGVHFESMANLEAASVVAFRRLARQLAHHGAPRELLARVRKAIRDEIRHARTTRRLAMRHGVTPRPPEVAPMTTKLPSLFEIARDNAEEGCVRETYGALVAHLQASRAEDREVRAAMSVIAEEETEHAALSWDLAAWLEAQLTELERRALQAVREHAIVNLARDLSAPVEARLASAAGVPEAPEALRILRGIAPMMREAA